MGKQWKAKGKELAANAKSRQFGKLAKEIQVSARSGGNDPDMNSKLRLLVDQAKRAGMPKDTLDRALKKSSSTDAADLQATTYEGFAPHQVAVIVECLTNNVTRTIAEMRVLFRKGQLGSAVTWDFDHVGLIEAQPDNAGTDPELAAIEAGAQDFEPAEEEGVTLFITDPKDLDIVCKALPAQGFKVLSTKIGYRPKNPVTNLGEAEQAEVEAFLAAIDDHDDVQNLYVAL